MLNLSCYGNVCVLDLKNQISLDNNIHQNTNTIYKGVVRELKLPNRVKETLLNTKVKEKDDRLYFTDPTNLPP